MGEKQHYIPQFLLRNWSDDGKSIKAYILDRGNVIDAAGIKSQAQEKNLYGKDQKIENLFSEIENAAAVVIRKLLQDDIELSVEDRCDMCLFLATEYTRTPMSFKSSKEVDEMVKAILPKRIPNNKLKKLGRMDAMQLRIGLQTLPFYMGLKHLLLISSQKKEFVIGQDPLLILNPYLEEKKWFRSKKGIGKKGVVVILPLSPKKIVCFYDSEIYSPKGLKKIIEASDNDIELLNALQFFSTENTVYFRKEDENFKEYASISKEYRNREKITWNKSIFPKNMAIYDWSKTDYPLEQKIDFLCIKVNAYKTTLTMENMMRDIYHFSNIRSF